MSSPALPEGYIVSADPALLDIKVIHDFLSQSYWAKDMPMSLIERMVKNSFCFGVYHHGAQVGFARVISDYTTFAYLADVFILPEHRGRGLSKALVAAIQAHPDLQGLRRWMLVTLDAHGLYEQFGFKPVAHPERHMEIHRPGLYQGAVASDR
jgi:N-acetylglutamate synthase-like GNAT family acetyltransferase